MSWKSKINDYPKYNKNIFVYPSQECRIINLILEILIHIKNNNNIDFYKKKFNLNYDIKSNLINKKELNNIINNFNQLIIYYDHKQYLFYINDEFSKLLKYKNHDDLIQKFKNNNNNQYINKFIKIYSAYILDNNKWLKKEKIIFHTYNGFKKEFKNIQNYKFYIILFQIVEYLFNNKDKIYNEKLLTKLKNQNIKFLFINNDIFFDIQNFSKKNFKKYYRSILKHIDKKNIKILAKRKYINPNALKQLLKKIRETYIITIIYELKLDDIDYKKLIKETQILKNIIKVFGNHIYELQYEIDEQYKIDLYFVNFKLAIQCDEQNYKNYNIQRDIIQENYIRNKLKCYIIKFNCHSDDFDIFNLIKKIYLYIRHK